MYADDTNAGLLVRTEQRNRHEPDAPVTARALVICSWRSSPFSELTSRAGRAEAVEEVAEEVAADAAEEEEAVRKAWSASATRAQQWAIAPDGSPGLERPH